MSVRDLALMPPFSFLLLLFTVNFFVGELALFDFDTLFKHFIDPVGGVLRRDI
jgi:hypothetical protein